MLKNVVTGQIKLSQAFSIFNGLYQDIHLGQKYRTLLTQKYLNKVHQIPLYLLSLRYAISSSYMNGSSKIFCKKLLFKIQGISLFCICTSYESYRSIVVASFDRAKLLTGVVTGCQFLMVMAPWDSGVSESNSDSSCINFILYE